MTDDPDRRPPIRLLGKREAIRHLIHASIRMFAHAEDPFAINLLIHSADKLTIDYAKRSGKRLRFDWDEYLRPDKKNEWFKVHREASNYFKHADTDFDRDLGIRDIANQNLAMLFICVINYQSVFGELTAHMRVLIQFIRLVMPDLAKEPDPATLLLQAFIHANPILTPRDYFTAITTLPFSPYREAFQQERAQDCTDIQPFYDLPLVDHPGARQLRDQG